jgi:hypothetical protein
MTNAWTFGWTQLLTLAGIGTTAYFANRGLRTFDKWRREKLEEKKIEVAVEALALAYQSKYVFEHIRQRVGSSNEYEDMPKIEGEEDGERNQRGSYYAVLKRIEYHRDFFEKVWEIQPKFMAIFGSDTEAIFQLLHSARREIESAISLMFQLKKPINKEENLQWVDLRRTVWSSNGATAKEDDKMVQNWSNSGQGLKAYAGRSSIGSSTRRRINQRWCASPPSLRSGRPHAAIHPPPLALRSRGFGGRLVLA